MNISFNFTGKVAVVTGGASGIGRATVGAFVSAGARVVILDVNEESGKKMAVSFLEQGRTTFLKTDVSSVAEVQAAAEKVHSLFGKVDFLVNNAGIEVNDKGSILEMPDEDIRRIIDVNLLGYINCARAFVPLMSRGGRIVNVSSIQAYGAHLPGTSYQASKAGIHGLTRSLAIELASRGITVNTIAPGAIATEGMGALTGGDLKFIDAYRHRIPLRRRGRPGEVAWPILFLCSDAASYIMSAELLIDGGYFHDITPDLGAPITPVEGDPDS